MASHFISAEFVKNHLKYCDLIPAVQRALASYSRHGEGGVDMPLRTVVSAKENNGLFFVKPAYSAEDGVFVTKIVSRYQDNPSRGLPSHSSTIWLFDGTTGLLRATLAGDYITDARTAAASAVATQLLAPEDSKVHTILGAGALAKSHFEALSTIHNFEEVRVWNHNYARAQRFAETHGCKAFHSAEEAVRGADVITTVTMASTPVLLYEWVKEGAHINGGNVRFVFQSSLSKSQRNLCHQQVVPSVGLLIEVVRKCWIKSFITVSACGAPLPTRQELDPSLMRAAVVYADSREGCMKESGDVILSKASVYAELGEVILGKAEARRKETTVFKSLGMAIWDLVAAKLLYDKFQQSLEEQS